MMEEFKQERQYLYGEIGVVLSMVAVYLLIYMVFLGVCGD